MLLEAPLPHWLCHFPSMLDFKLFSGDILLYLRGQLSYHCPGSASWNHLRMCSQTQIYLRIFWKNTRENRTRKMIKDVIIRIREDIDDFRDSPHRWVANKLDVRRLRMRECLEMPGNLRWCRGKLRGFDLGLSWEWVWVLLLSLEWGEGRYWGAKKSRWILE